MTQKPPQSEKNFSRGHSTTRKVKSPLSHGSKNRDDDSTFGNRRDSNSNSDRRDSADRGEFSFGRSQYTPHERWESEFERTLKKRSPRLELISAEPFAEMEYANEVTLKSAALMDYFRSLDLSEKVILPLVPAEMARGYRRSSRRRVVVAGSTVLFQLGGNTIDTKRVQSLLEPAEFQVIYDWLHERLCKRDALVFARALNYVVIRGDVAEPHVIFNISETSAEVIRKAKQVGERMQAELPQVASARLLVNASRSKYYLDFETEPRQIVSKSLYGPGAMKVSYGNEVFFVSPFSFLQVNPSVLASIVDYIKRKISLHGIERSSARLLDLYCGFGLFGFLLREQFASVIGMESNDFSIRSANNTVIFLSGKSESNSEKKIGFKFVDKEVSPRSLERFIGNVEATDVVVIDPPRVGASEGVIEYFAENRPGLVFHLVCGIDVLPRELKRWKKAGYQLTEIVPFDMFAGTAEIELLLVFVPRSTTATDTPNVLVKSVTTKVSNTQRDSISTVTDRTSKRF